jgi:hypothetical protein
MKGKACDNNTNMAIGIVMGILLLIVVWYVFFSKSRESFDSITVSDGDDSITMTNVGLEALGAATMVPGVPAARVATRRRAVAVDATH